MSIKDGGPSFTPGPWFTTRQGFSTVYVEAHISGGLIQEVAACGPTQDHKQQEANARLISAAPDMYEALKATLRELTACANQLAHHGYRSPEGGSVHSAQQEARAALARASGQ